MKQSVVLVGGKIPFDPNIIKSQNNKMISKAEEIICLFIYYHGYII